MFMFLKKINLLIDQSQHIFLSWYILTWRNSVTLFSWEGFRSFAAVYMFPWKHRLLWLVEIFFSIVISELNHFELRYLTRFIKTFLHDRTDFHRRNWSCNNLWFHDLKVFYIIAKKSIWDFELWNVIALLCLLALIVFHFPLKEMDWNRGSLSQSFIS